MAPGGLSTPMPTYSAFAGTATDGAGTMYIAGGYPGGSNPVADVFAAPYSAGQFASWVTEPSLPATRARGALAVSNGFLLYIARARFRQFFTLHRAYPAGM